MRGLAAIYKGGRVRGITLNLKNMKKRPLFRQTTISRCETEPGQTIEERIERMKANKEPISDGAPLIYTDRKDGVLAGYDIRTDRFEVALGLQEKMEKSKAAKKTAAMRIVKDEPIQDDPGNNEKSGFK